MIGSLQSVYDTGLLSTSPVLAADFNDPRIKTTEARYRVQNRLARLIDTMPPGGLLMLTSYTSVGGFLLPRIVRALNRGVHFQILIDAHSKTDDTEMIASACSNADAANSWLHYIDGPDRGSSGTGLHSKTWMGLAPDGTNTVLVGSSNLSDFAATNQFQDMTRIVNHPEAFKMFVDTFDDQASPSAVANPYVQKTAEGGLFAAQFYPDPGIDSTSDPLMARLNALGTANTVSLDLALHAWNGERGQWLATKVADLYLNGMQVRVLRGKHFDAGVLDTLTQANIPLRQAVFDGNVSIHHKTMLARDGHQGSVWTGSNDWDGNYDREEVDVQIKSNAHYQAYRAHFDRLWVLAS